MDIVLSQFSILIAVSPTSVTVPFASEPFGTIQSPSWRESFYATRTTAKKPKIFCLNKIKINPEKAPSTATKDAGDLLNRIPNTMMTPIIHKISFTS